MLAAMRSRNITTIKFLKIILNYKPEGNIGTRRPKAKWRNKDAREIDNNQL
jgi:hypothetical protein